MIRQIPIEQIRPNPDQPRKEFDEAGLHELAASIREHGLIQPVAVTKNGDGYIIIAGERRFRAHKLANLATVRCDVVNVSDQERDERAIIENLQRVDITPYEEAIAYQRMMVEYDLTVEELARRLGIKQPWRITERTSLLRLQERYQDLLRKGHLTPSQATELSRLDGPGQDTLFRAIKRGACPTYNDLRAAADAILEAGKQSSFLRDEGPSDAERRRAKTFESRMASLAQMLRDGIKDNEITAVRKVDPTRAETLADVCFQMGKDLKRIEKALRQAAVQADLMPE